MEERVGHTAWQECGGPLRGGKRLVALQLKRRTMRKCVEGLFWVENQQVQRPDVGVSLVCLRNSRARNSEQGEQQRRRNWGLLGRQVLKNAVRTFDFI